jgi:hypothetical protein
LISSWSGLLVTVWDSAPFTGRGISPASFLKISFCNIPLYPSAKTDNEKISAVVLASHALFLQRG